MIDQDLLTEIQFALLEAPDGGQSFPSAVWTRAEVLDAVNGGERTLLREAHLLLQRTEISVLAGTIAIDLPTDWLATALVVWRDSLSVRTLLSPSDETELDLAIPDWRLTAATPKVYLDSDTDTLTLRLGPMPLADGTVELWYVARPEEVNGNGREFTVPDDFTPGIKYDALATLLSKAGRLQDPRRAAYCRQRVELIVAASEILLQGGA